MGAAWITLSRDGRFAYIAEPVTDTEAVVDIKTMKQVASIPVGYTPKRNTTGMIPYEPAKKTTTSQR